MADDTRRDPASDPERETARGDADGSELEEGIEHLGRVVGGVVTRLLGSRYTRVELDPDRPVISPRADAALDRAADTVGRWLRATGDGLSIHPADPLAALDHAKTHHEEAVELREGEAPLAAGARALAQGLYHSTEAVLDAVAPRQEREPGGEE